MNPASKLVQVATYVDPATYAAIGERAQRDGMSRSEFVRQLIERNLNQDTRLQSEVGKRTLYLSIALDQLIQHVDPDLRSKVHGIFKARLEEDPGHAG